MLCLGNRLRDVNIKVMKEFDYSKGPSDNFFWCSRIAGAVPQGSSISIPCQADPQPKGRFVFIQIIRDAAILTLCEVKVFGESGTQNYIF